MMHYYYFTAQYIKEEEETTMCAMSQMDKDYFDFVDAAEMIADDVEVGIQSVIITFWKEVNKAMYDKYRKVVWKTSKK